MFPERLACDHIKSWSNEGDVVLDPFMGSGTTAKVARALGRHYIGFEISKEYCDLANKRLQETKTLFD
jgi:site-specific DNA-methyltransferase (adenine-specific)